MQCQLFLNTGGENGMFNKIKYIFILLLLCTSVYAVDLNTMAEAKVQVYKFHSFDTTGVDNLDTGTVSGYIGFGIARVNEDLLSRKLRTTIVTASGTELYGLDSAISVRACFAFSGNNIKGIKYLNIKDAPSQMLEEIIVESDSLAEYYFRWGDSIGFLPTPVGVDTFWIFYSSEISDGAISVLPYKYRLGAVLYAAYLAAIDIKVDPTPFLTAYNIFVKSKRVEAVAENE